MPALYSGPRKPALPPVRKHFPSPPRPPAKPKLPLSPYRNPFAASGPLTGGRIDQGVDYTGRPGAPIGAIGPGRIVKASTSSGWPGGGFIGEQLSAGPAKGQVVFTAEDVAPTVKVGQKVKAGQQIGYFNQGGYIESGYGTLPPNTGQALAYGKQSAPGSDPGAYSTGYGIAFNKLIAQLGGPTGKLQSVVSGSAPAKFSSTGGRVPGVKPVSVPSPAFTPVPSPAAGSMPVSFATPIAGSGRGGGKPLTVSVKRIIPKPPRIIIPPAVPPPPPALGGTTPGVSISSGSLTGNVINNGLPGFTPTSQGPAVPAPKTSVGTWLIGAAAVAGLIYLLVRRNT